MVERRRPPGVDVLAARLAADPHTGQLPRPLLVDIARHALADAGAGDPTAVATAAATGLIAQRPRRVVNGTGVILHTNLGRAPLHEEAAEAAHRAATGYGNVEIDTVTGSRGRRHGYISELLAALVGAEAAVAVNNNAAALMLALAALAAPGSVAVSRGELIEIGGSFRLPELMAATGAHLVEVGTTNRTHLADYAGVVDRVEVLLKVHPSNYWVEGFTTAVGYRELADLARRHGRALVADIGSGLLDSRAPWLPGTPPSWLAGEPGARQTLTAGADLVLFSGDKLFGGPQAGLIAGRADLVARLTRHPLMRAIRLDGPTMAALAATLDLYGAGRGGEIPVWRMAALTSEDLLPRVRHLATLTGGTVIDGHGVAGAGSTPNGTIPGPLLAMDQGAERLWRRLLDANPPVLTRRHDGRLLIDLRTVEPGDDAHVAAALTAV